MNKRTLINKLKKFPNFNKLKFVYLFGSRAREDSAKKSDFDICLYYDIKDQRKLFKLLFKIKGSLPDNIDVHMFQLLPLYVKKEIFKGKLLFYRDMDLVYDTAFNTFRDFEDFRRRYEFYILNTKENPFKVML